MGVSRTLTILLCVSVLLSTPVGAVSITPLTVPPIDGDTSSVSSAPWVTIESNRLNVSTGSASGMLVNVTNYNESADKSGEIRARLLTLDGVVVARANQTVYVKEKGKTANCDLTFDTPAGLSEFAIVLVTVDTSVDVAKKDADCTSTGQGRGPPGS